MISARVRSLPRYVLTGVPCSGKTTVLEQLKERGYAVVPEVARIVIERSLEKGITAHELRKDEEKFQRKILNLKLKNEEKAPKRKVLFFDRGVPDSIAYYTLANLDPKGVIKVSSGRYRKIFFFEALPFEKDRVRIEDKVTVRKLDSLLRKAYLDLGYELIVVPRASVKERVTFILSNL